MPWSEEARAIQERVQCLALWQPREKWPDLSDAHLRDTAAQWLGPYLNGIRSREGLRSLKMTEILRGILDWRQQKRLEQDAPTHIQVPSGSRIRLRYVVGEPPVLAVRLQEMFGLAEIGKSSANAVRLTANLPLILYLIDLGGGLRSGLTTSVPMFHGKRLHSLTLSYHCWAHPVQSSTWQQAVTQEQM